MARFALIGAAGYVAPRHMKAIKAVGGDLKVAFDPNDSVGVIDSHFPDAHFFTEFERFDRHIDKIAAAAKDRLRFDLLTNYLHDAHCRFALRSGANAICEKPLVLNPWNIDGLEEMEQRTGRNVSTILQFRLHPAIQALKEKVAADQKNGSLRPDLHHLARPLVLRVVEGRRGEVRRGRHQYRRAFLRHALLRFRPAARERRAPARTLARGRVPDV